MSDCAFSTNFLVDAPYRPEVSSPTDTSNFDIEGDDFSPCDTKPPNVSAPFTGHHLPFIGFTYTHDSHLSDCGNLAVLLTNDVNMADPNEAQLSADAYQRRIARLENEKSEMSRKLMGE